MEATTADASQAALAVPVTAEANREQKEKERKEHRYPSLLKLFT